MRDVPHGYKNDSCLGDDIIVIAQIPRFLAVCGAILHPSWR
jgi:hypothetical protein